MWIKFEVVIYTYVLSVSISTKYEHKKFIIHRRLSGYPQGVDS